MFVVYLYIKVAHTHNIDTGEPVEQDIDVAKHDHICCVDSTRRN